LSDAAPEVLDGVPVVAEPSAAAVAPVATPRQVAALAATGFVAGATAVMVVERRRRRGGLLPFRRRRRGPRKGVLGEIVGSNAFLVEVHLLRRD
jgi:hypothetical protein